MLLNENLQNFHGSNRIVPAILMFVQWNTYFIKYIDPWMIARSVK